MRRLLVKKIKLHNDLNLESKDQVVLHSKQISDPLLTKRHLNLEDLLYDIHDYNKIGAEKGELILQIHPRKSYFQQQLWLT